MYVVWRWSVSSFVLKKLWRFFFFLFDEFLWRHCGCLWCSGCSPMQAVSRDVAIVVQFWCAIEHIRLQSMISFVTSLFRFVVSFAVLEMCVCGEQAMFVAGGTKKHWLRRDSLRCGRSVSCDRTPASGLAFVPGALLRERRNMGGGPIAVGRCGATFVVVAVSSQFVVKCVCSDFWWLEGQR